MDPLGQNQSHFIDRILVLSANGNGARADVAEFITHAEKLGWLVIQDASAGAAGFGQITLARLRA